MDNEYKKLNDDWIIKFENTENLYKDFYKDNLYYIPLKYIYINQNNEIEKINQESFLLTTPNYISREEILKILKITSVHDLKSYSLLSILKYNITMDFDDITNFVNLLEKENGFLNIVKNIDAISFEKTINMFHDLNELIFIFYEKTIETKITDPDKSTKKIYLHSNIGKKTKKKRYKEFKTF
jgi:hypothetical protein